MKEPLSNTNRRQFLKTGGVLAAGLLSHEARAATNPLPALSSNPRTQAAMPTRNLGKTGYKVGIFSLGGQSAIEEPNNFDIAVPLIERALDLGVNFIDTAPRYGPPDRWSEQYIGASWTTAATTSSFPPRAWCAAVTAPSGTSSSPSSS